MATVFGLVLHCLVILAAVSGSHGDATQQPLVRHPDCHRLARFERETQVLASLNHSNIATLYGIEALGDTHALVLELVEERVPGVDPGLDPARARGEVQAWPGDVDVHLVVPFESAGPRPRGAVPAEM